MFKGLKDVRVWGVTVFGALSLLLPTNAKAAAAAPVKLAWAPSTDTGVAGYAVYYGLANVDPARLDVGVNTQAVVPNLTANANYTFKVVAYSADGAESVPSNVIQYSPPVLTKVQLNKIALGIMKVEFRGPTGVSCRVQYTTSLSPANWQTLGSATAAADGTVSIIDAGARTAPMRFYRAVYP